MTKRAALLVAAIAALSACATTPPPPPVPVDTNISASIAHGDVDATLQMMSASEIDAIFGERASERFSVLDVRIANRGDRRLSAGYRFVRLAMPGRDVYPLDAYRVAQLTRGTGVIGTTGILAIDAIQLVSGLAAMKRNYDVAATWSGLMPDTIAAGPRASTRVVFVFDTKVWPPKTLHLIVPLAHDDGTSAGDLDMPLPFRALDTAQ
jgi:hypothetical protein